eukprot:gene18516-25018_t
MLGDYFGEGMTAAHLKMTETPEGDTELIQYDLDCGAVSPFPLVRCHGNIYVLPGVPHLLRQKWSAIKNILEKEYELAPFRNKVFRLSIADETKIAELLETVQTAYGDVQVGSYPVTEEEDGALTLVTLDSKKCFKLESAAAMMRSLLPAEYLLAEDSDVKALSRQPSVCSSPTK